jgi:hypothetical protein
LASITEKKSFELFFDGSAIASESLKARAGNAFSSDALLLAAVADRGERGKSMHTFGIAGRSINKRANVQFVVGEGSVVPLPA